MVQVWWRGSRSGAPGLVGSRSGGVVQDGAVGWTRSGGVVQDGAVGWSRMVPWGGLGLVGWSRMVRWGGPGWCRGVD